MDVRAIMADQRKARTMANPWGTVDGFMRELGSLRAQANTIEDGGSVAEEVARRIESAIEAAASAVNDMIATPANSAVVARAREAIAAAEQIVGTLRSTAAVSRQLASESVALRRRSADLTK